MLKAGKWIHWSNGWCNNPTKSGVHFTHGASPPHYLAPWLMRPRSPFQPYDSSPDSSHSEMEGDEFVGGFNFTLVSPIKAVKEALKWEDSSTPPAKQKIFFKHLEKEHSNFPLLSELKDIIDEKWSKVDKKTSMSSRTSRLYAFKAEQVKYLENTALVDAALMRLAKCVTLPLVDALSFKDGLETRIDQDLKRIYGSAGMAYKPPLALAAKSKAMEVWMENVDSMIRGVQKNWPGAQ